MHLSKAGGHGAGHVGAAASTDPASHARGLLRDARHAAAGRILLDLFCGVGHITRQWRRAGWGVVSMDLARDPAEDLTRRDVLRLIKAWLRSKLIGGVWLAPPCSSWSSARRGAPGTRGGPLRSRQHVWGLPNVEADAQPMLAVGNATAAATLQIINLCVKLHIPVAVENPTTSLLWQVPALLRLSRHHSCHRHVSDFCQYGTPWRKRTTVLSWYTDGEGLQLRCRSTKGVCDRTGLQHVRLTGSDKAGPLTRQAQPYPPLWAADGAKLVTRAIDLHDYHKLCQASSGLATKPATRWSSRFQ